MGSKRNLIKWQRLLHKVDTANLFYTNMNISSRDDYLSLYQET